MTRVLFDAHQLGRRQTGNETYVRELLRALRAIDDITIDAAVESTTTPTGVLAPPSRIHRVPSNGLARLASIALRARMTRPDVVHAMYFLPALTGAPTVVSIHDISFERFPEFFSRSALLRDRTFIRWSARRADRIVTLSDASRRDLIEVYGIPEHRVIVTPLGVSNAFRPAADGEPPAAARSDAVRILAVGTLQPRKNLVRLFEAVRLLSPELQIALRLVGPAGYQAAAIREQVAGEATVEFLGYVSDEELAAEYRAADMLVYPSLYEGFGLPVLEAMACGTPVVTTTGGALPEVAGAAAEVVDPRDVDALAAAIRRVATDRQHASRLRALGLTRAAEFTWARTAALHAAVYRDVASA